MYASEYKYLYNTQKWKNISIRFRLSHPNCALCGEPGKVCDHIIPHKGDEKLFYDKTNIQNLCHQCHNSDKARIENGQKPGVDFIPNNKSDMDGLPTSKFHPWNNK